MGERGIFVDGSEQNHSIYFSLPSFTNHIVDNNGSGDALLAYSSLTLKVSGSIVMASIIGSIAASRECEIEGNIPISSKNIIEKIETIKNETRYKFQK